MDHITASLGDSGGLLGESDAKFETWKMEFRSTEMREVFLIKGTFCTKAQRSESTSYFQGTERSSSGLWKWLVSSAGILMENLIRLDWILQTVGKTPEGFRGEWWLSLQFRKIMLAVAWRRDMWEERLEKVKPISGPWHYFRQEWMVDW